ncbi:MAG: hypothetical protein JNJ44_03955 [Zoogloeaceae bacterium]|nr:hypothetical protein [Zoogloeaceae bacterium]
MNATELHQSAAKLASESPPRYIPRQKLPPAFGPARLSGMSVAGAGAGAAGHPPGHGRTSLITHGLTRRLALALVLTCGLWAVVLWALA